MLNVLLVALGGAVGSVLRYLLGNFGVALLGAAFPWPTIGINIVGSFVIGFVGAATLPGGVLPNSAALRALVMVGVCGGFTTFSSFSLQTLDLLRDARVAAAFANITVSVLLCLASVAGGYYAATGTALRAISRQADSALHTRAVVLAVLDEPDRAEAILEAAHTLLRVTHGGRLLAIAPRPPALADISTTEEVPSEEIAGKVDSEGGRVTSLRQLYEHWWDRAGNSHHDSKIEIDANFDEPQGEAAILVAAHGVKSDVVVIGRPSSGDGERRRGEIHAAIFDTRRPVLMVPPGPPREFGRTVAIGWTDDRRTRSAVFTSLPMLREAARVVVLTDDDHLTSPRVLTDEGIEASMCVFDGPGATGERLLQAAHGESADLLVIGAYRHSAFRERLLGGVTRHMLEKSDLPLLMRH